MNKNRLEAFTDAIIAIAATIMVLELHIPQYNTLASLVEEWPVFLAYFISFTLIYTVWYNHHNLFKKAKIYITGKYKGVKNDGYNEVEPEQIVMDVNGSNEKTIIINLAGANVWSVSNRYELNFKDGKVMIKPIFRELSNTIERNSTAGMSSLFNKKGEPKKDKAILFVESETNEFVADFIKGMKNEISNDW